MKNGYRRLNKPVLAVVLTTGTLAACYQSVWKADYQSDVENGRNYSVTSAVDAQGNLLVGGGSTVAISQDDQGNEIVHYQPTLLKYASNGALLWSFQHDNGQRRTTARPATSISEHLNDYQGGAEIQRVTSDAAGNIYAAGIVAGLNYSSDTNDYDVAVFGLSADGTLLWTRIIEQPTLDTTLTLGLSQTGKLLLGIHHFDHMPGQYAESISVLALDSTTGTIAWQRDHAATPAYSTSTPLYAGINLVSPSHAATNARRIAITQQDSGGSGTIYVYDENGTLLWQRETANAAASTDIGTSCSPSENTFINGLAFVANDLIVARSSYFWACSIFLAELFVERHDAQGNRMWSTEVPDPQGLEATLEHQQAYDDYLSGERSSFTSFYLRGLFSDAHVAVADDAIYVAATGVSNYLSPALPRDTYSSHPTIGSLVAAFSPSGDSLWTKALAKKPVLVRAAGTGALETIDSSWLATAALTLNSAGKPVIALNELSAVRGADFYPYDFHFTQLTGIASQLVEFNPATGKHSAFGAEEQYLARHVSANGSKGVFKTGDNFNYLPGFKYIIPEGTPDSPSNIHVSHLRAR